MTTDDFVQYWKPACVNLIKLGIISGNQYTGGRPLDTLLGVDEYRQWFPTSSLHGTDPLPDELKNVCRYLQGPHAVTILKAFRIRKGLDK